MGVKLSGFMGGLAALGLLAACGGEAAAPAESGVGPELAQVETACLGDLKAKIPNPEAAKVEAIAPVEWREYASGLRTAVFGRLSGQTLGQMEKVADKSLTGGESATDKTWRLKLKARAVDGRDVTVPAWCRSLKTAPAGCECETPLRTE